MVRHQETVIAAEGDRRNANDAGGLRRFADLLCLWRVCGNAACRRGRACRGRARHCARRNFPALPPLVRDFVAAFRAARSCRIPFETFQAEMAGSPEAEAYFAWAGAAKSALFSSQVRNKRDAPQNGA
jgi:hypothetical protein